MAIEARGAKFPYVVVVGAFCLEVRHNLNINHYRHMHLFMVADSDDETYGKAMKAAHIIYPTRNEYKDHWCHIISLANIDWIQKMEDWSVDEQARPY